MNAYKVFSGFMQPEISLPAKLLSTAFPFHFALDRGCQIIQVGDVLKRLLPTIVGHHLSEVFNIQRPQLTLDFETICHQTHRFFILESCHNDLALKGQMMNVEAQDVLLFLGSPIVNDISHLKGMGIKLKDFAIHDPVTDYLLLLQTKSNLMNELTAQKNQLEDALQKKADLANLAESRAIEVETALANLQSVQTQLVQTEKMSALGNLVAGVAHEINNPVGCIIGNVGATQDYINDLLGLIDLYRKQFSEPGPDIEAELEAVDLEFMKRDLPQLILAMKESGERIKSISKSLRTFSRSDTAHKQIFDLRDGLDSTILILRHRLKANNQRPAIQIMTNYVDPPQQIVCFPGQLNQVFMNILANAIDALDEASQNQDRTKLTAHPHRISISTVTEGDRVKIEIADNGPGIPEEIRMKIFDHLFTTKAAGKGTGLGLAIVRQIVEDNHGGILDVQSTVGQGTLFSVELPIEG